jgi:hypothetical protein
MCVHRDTGAQRAVKVLRKSHMDEDEKKMLFNEINILRGLVSNLSLFFLRTSDSYTPQIPLLTHSPHPQIVFSYLIIIY